MSFLERPVTVWQTNLLSLWGSIPNLILKPWAMHDLILKDLEGLG
jgi:hypothetical protein